MVGCTRNQVLVKVDHPSIGPTLGGLVLEFPRDMGEDLAFKPHPKDNECIWMVY